MKFPIIKTLLLIVSIFLLYVIFQTIHYFVQNGYIIECFDKLSESTSHTVNMPLTDPYSCSNFCGPAARCAITGHQCFADVDCPGCQTPQAAKESKHPTATLGRGCIPGNNDAGKLTVGVTPTYSSLTSGYGTRERIVTKDLYSKPVQPNLGVNQWRHAFDEGRALYDRRYKPPHMRFMPTYAPRYSLTGDFIDDGPLPSNY